MIPVNRDRYIFHPRLQVAWVPASFVSCRFPSQPSPVLPSSSQHQPMHLLHGTSPDELCAASVLLNLGPKEGTSHSLSSPQTPPSRLHHNLTEKGYFHLGQRPLRQPRPLQTTSIPDTVLVPSEYARRWENVYHRHEPNSRASPVSRVSEEGSSDEESLSRQDSFSSNESTCDVPQSSENESWFSGCVSLALAEDTDVLSPLHSFMRRYCVEVFSATPQDVSLPRYGKSHGLKVVEGQVGIRCVYCKHRKPGSRPERAVCYPSSLKNIYHSIETWQRRHSLVCGDIPAWVRRSMTELMESSKSRAGGRRQYWEDSARRLGMVDTPHGVRFARKPGDLGEPGQLPPTPRLVETGKPIVDADDRDLITEYLYLLMEQMETCRFTEEDRTGGRSKIKNNEVGFPGMQCKWCQGKAGFGRYFPTTANALALANSDRNIYNHIQKCRRCPPKIKSNLIRLSKEQMQTKNRRGLRKMFFQRVWNRIHEQNA